MGCTHPGHVAEPALEVKVADIAVDLHMEYVLVKKLGVGGFGAVYSATKVGGTEEVAVKVMDLRANPSDSVGFEDSDKADSKQVHQFHTEMQNLQAVAGHENVCRILGSDTRGMLGYIVLEKCDRTLVQALELTPMVNEQTLQPYFQGMLKGLEFIHRRGVVHRDVKPDNFMCCGPQNTVKLCDFGLSCMMPAAHKDTPCTGIVGSVPFMAPEMLRRMPYGEKVDAWSLGVVAFTLSFGRYPYSPAANTAVAMRQAVMEGTPPAVLRRARGPRSARFRSFMLMLLDQSPRLRLSAKAASKHEWFQHAVTSLTNMRPALQLARRLPGFDASSGTMGRFAVVDQRLRELQARVHPSQQMMKKATPPMSEVSTDAGAVTDILSGPTNGTPMPCASPTHSLDC